MMNMCIGKPFASCSGSIMRRSCSGMRAPEEVIINLSPDTSKFVIKRSVNVRCHSVIHITYENCSNYSGNKILVYRNTDCRTIEKMARIDPHFEENPNIISPVARFEPTPEGWALATRFAREIL